MKSLKKKKRSCHAENATGRERESFLSSIISHHEKKRFFQFVSLILGPMCYQLDDRPSIGHRFLTLVKYFSSFYGAREVAAADR